MHTYKNKHESPTLYYIRSQCRTRTYIKSSKNFCQLPLDELGIYYLHTSFASSNPYIIIVHQKSRLIATNNGSHHNSLHANKKGPYHVLYSGLKCIISHPFNMKIWIRTSHTIIRIMVRVFHFSRFCPEVSLVAELINLKLKFATLIATTQFTWSNTNQHYSQPFERAVPPLTRLLVHTATQFVLRSCDPGTN